MDSLLILSSADVSQLTTSLRARDLTRMIGRTMYSITNSAVSSDVPGIQNPARISTVTNAHKFLYMPSRWTSSLSESATAIKVVAVPNPSCTVEGLPATTLLFDENTGRCKAVVNSGVLTGLRTAAASALATLVLADADSKHLVIFGTGMQAYYHAILILELFPSISHVVFVARSHTSRSQQLVDKISTAFQHVHLKVVTGDQVGETVARADIVCTCVPSLTPLFHDKHLKPNVHINAIGSYTPSMLDFPPSLITPPDGPIPVILVDSREACLQEAGELVAARIKPESCIELGEIVTELGDVENPEGVRQRLRVHGRSLYKGVGIGGMDVAIAELLYELAKGTGVGTIVPY